MPSRRVLKAAEAVREVVSMAILTDLNDPRVEAVTVTRVEVTPDMRQAKVHVSIMGNETKQKLCLAGLRSAAGYLQSKVANRIDTRYTPRLEFVLDLGVKKSIEIAEILGRVLPKAAASDDESEAAKGAELGSVDDNDGEIEDSAIEDSDSEDDAQDDESEDSSDIEHTNASDGDSTAAS